MDSGRVVDTWLAVIYWLDLAELIGLWLSGSAWLQRLLCNAANLEVKGCFTTILPQFNGVTAMTLSDARLLKLDQLKLFHSHPRLHTLNIHLNDVIQPDVFPINITSITCNTYTHFELLHLPTTLITLRVVCNRDAKRLKWDSKVLRQHFTQLQTLELSGGSYTSPHGNFSYLPRSLTKYHCDEH